MLVEDLLKITEPLEPETLDFVEPALTPLKREQILAMTAIRRNDMVLEDMDIFKNVVFLLNDMSADIFMSNVPEPEWIWKALIMLNKLKPKFKLSWEVKVYIKYIFDDEGYNFYPPLSGLDNPNFAATKALAVHGPFPLDETRRGIQAVRYLKIKEYLKQVR
jgi:hypothetical protein